MVVFATGYRPADPSGCSASRRMCRRDEAGRAAASTATTASHTDAELRGGIYLQGGTEHTHGISSSLLSNTAVRAGEILDSVLGHRRPGPGLPATHESGEPATVGPGWGDPGVVTS